MKTPEEIKKALYQCGRGEFKCSECAYYDESEKRGGCGYVLNLHALAYIQQLEEALLLMVYQYCCDDDGCVSHRCMTAGEHAFAALGIENYCNIEVIKKRLDEMESIHKTPLPEAPKE